MAKALELARWALQVFLLALVKGYRVAISPLLPPACRFYPSCSAYAEQALRRHGPIRGTVLTARRLMRCHPLHEGGIDPVP
ncbi:MAG: membrane protein insertion efficiency factor YidD [Deltaproteobacteria bacterium]|nr:membrane protein insertion efficiency factor YidD [Deltaproteobacteria bacterium]